MDKEQKIAEIRKSAEEARKTDRSWVDGQDYADDVEFLLDELERLERAAHNAHVTELLDREAKLNQVEKALKTILYMPSSHPYVRMVADEALQSIKGGESGE